MNETPTNYVSVTDMEHLLREDGAVTLIDARTPEEFAGGHVQGAINVPIADLADFAQKNSKGSENIVITMCGSTGRGEKASAILSSHGLANIKVMKGGLKAWQEAGLPLT